MKVILALLLSIATIGVENWRKGDHVQAAASYSDLVFCPGTRDGNEGFDTTNSPLSTLVVLLKVHQLRSILPWT